MMIVQKVEISGIKTVVRSLHFPSSAGSKTGTVGALLRFYVVVIYICHFKKSQYYAGYKFLVGAYSHRHYDEL